MKKKQVDLGDNTANLLQSVGCYADIAGTQLVAASTYTYNLGGQLKQLNHNRSGTNKAQLRMGL